MQEKGEVSPLFDVYPKPSVSYLYIEKDSRGRHIWPKNMDPCQSKCRHTIWRWQGSILVTPHRRGTHFYTSSVQSGIEIEKNERYEIDSKCDVGLIQRQDFNQIESLLDNAPNLVVGCIIQKRYNKLVPDLVA